MEKDILKAKKNVFMFTSPFELIICKPKKALGCKSLNFFPFLGILFSLQFYRDAKILPVCYNTKVKQLLDGGFHGQRF